jgi:hypothetical protein
MGMKRALLTDDQVDALIIATHGATGTLLALEDRVVLDTAVEALRARDDVEVTSRRAGAGKSNEAPPAARCTSVPVSSK